MQRTGRRFRIIDDSKKSRYGGRWAVFDREEGVGYVIYRDKHGELECACFQKDCIHQKVVRNYLEKHGKRIVNECGSAEAKAIQDKLNGSNGNSGTGDDKSPAQTYQLDTSDPFQECESLDIAQIEGRRNGDLVHKLSNGEYVISYNGIMHLVLKLGIEFTVSEHDDTHAIIAYAKLRGHESLSGSTRMSGKPINGSVFTAGELAKRNAARQLLPYPEIKALEKKAQFFHEFTWEKAKAACQQLVPKFKMDIAIHDLVQAGKLRQAHPSDYDRTEWLMIYRECKKDAETNGNDDDDNNDGGGAEFGVRSAEFGIKKNNLSWQFKSEIRNPKSEIRNPLPRHPPKKRSRSRSRSCEERSNLSLAKQSVDLKVTILGGSGGKNSFKDASAEWKVKLTECQEAAKSFLRYDILKEDLQKEGIIPKELKREWDDSNFATLKEACEIDASLFGRKVGRWTIELEPNEKIWAWFGRYDFWLTPLRERCFWCEETSDNLQDCCVEWKRYSFKTLLCLDCKPSTEELTEKFDRLYRGVADPSECRPSLREPRLPHPPNLFR